MDENTIAEMRARATAAKERIDAVEEGEVDEPEFDEVVTAAAMFANDAAALAEDVDALTGEVERLTGERDAYKKAKAENDERFMLERDEARHERDDLFMTVNALNRNAEESLTKLEALRQERDAALLKAQILEDGAAGWQTENATLRAEIGRLRDPALLTNLEQWDILPGGTYAPAFRDRMERVGAIMRDAGNEIAGLRAEVERLTSVVTNDRVAFEAVVAELRGNIDNAMEAMGGDSRMGVVEMAKRCRDWRRGLLKDSEEAKERASHANVALYDLKVAFDRERAALTSKLASIEPIIDALLCADRQELPRDLADRVTAYVKALPCPAVTP